MTKSKHRDILEEVFCLTTLGKKKDNTTKSPHIFAGFDEPHENWFKTPWDWTDITFDIDNIAELKCVQYVLKHTWGYKEYRKKKRITIDEFVQGRKKKDGSRLDKGTGLSERAVRYGLAKAIEHGYLEEDIDASDRARIKKSYGLKMQPLLEDEEPDPKDDSSTEPPENDPIPSKNTSGFTDSEGIPTQDVGVQTLHPQDIEVQDMHLEVANFAPRTETEYSDRILISNSRIEIDKEKGGGFKKAGESYNPPFKMPPKESKGAQEALSTPEEDQTPSIAHSTPQDPLQPSTIEMLNIVGTEVSKKYGEQGKTRGNITRLTKIYRFAQSKGYGEHDFLEKVYQAERLTRDRQLDRNLKPLLKPITYWFTVFEDLLGYKSQTQQPFIPHQEGFESTTTSS